MEPQEIDVYVNPTPSGEIVMGEINDLFAPDPPVDVADVAIAEAMRGDGRSGR
jgi:hypothetical protein